MAQTDGVKLQTWLLLIVVLVGGYIVARIGPGEIRNFQIQHTVETAAQFQADPSKKETVSVYLSKKIFDMDLPIKEEDFHIEDDGDTARIWIDWEKEVTFIPQNPIIPAYKKLYKYHNEAIEKVKR